MKTKRNLIQTSLLVAALSLAVCAALVPVRASATDCTTPPSGLVGWWPGDGSALDLTSYHNDGTFQGGANYAPGNVGQAFSFNGSSGYVMIPASPTVNVGMGGSLTIETWINPGDISNQRPLVEWNNGTTWGVHFWISVISAGPGSIYANVMDTGNHNHVFASAPGIVKTNSFQHVAMTYNQSSGIGTLYYNGAPVATNSLGVFTPKTTDNLYLGYRPGYAPTSVPMLEDEVSIYNRALSAPEIQAIYAAGAAGKCKTLQIVAQPQSQIWPLTQPATISVAVSGNSPLAYQWWKDDALVSGATNSTLTFMSLQPANYGSYWVVVTNMSGSVTSAVAALTFTNVYDVVADFSASANSNGVWSYGWCTNVGGQFQLMATNQFLPGIIGWWNGVALPNSVSIFKNLTASAITNGLIFDTDTLLTDPESYAVVVRFTAPTNGIYQVQGLFRLQVPNPPARNLNIQINNTNTAYYFNTAGGVNGSEYPFNFPVSLKQGDSLDFISSYAGNYAALGTGLKAAIALSTNVLTNSQFDATADFSTNANPNGVWSYGWFTSFGAPFQLLRSDTNSYPVAGVPEVFAWVNGGTVVNLSAVTVAGNSTGIPYGQTIRPNVIFYPDTLCEDPEGYVVTVRFTAPEDGLYAIQGFFRLQDTTTSLDNQHDVMILTNTNRSSPVFYQHTSSKSFGTQYPFNTTTFLARGTTLDFIASPTGEGHGLSTGVKATITLLPIIIQSPLLAGANFTFSFSTVGSQSYTVQQNTNLATTNWMFCTNIIGNGSFYQFQAPVSSDGQQFFRVSAP